MEKRIFSGIQPSGRLHLGNYLGAMKNWIPLQDKYRCIFGIVDYHAMTVTYNPKEMEKRILDAAVNYIACGLDPKKAILMIQSLVPEHTELAWIFNTLVPVPRLSRIPTYKEKIQQHPENVNMGLLDYPVLMAADILIYKSFAVPVGEDQLPHLEISREIARKFNATFGKIFPEPQSITEEKGMRILGLDGVNRMSKTLDNCIYLDDTKEDVEKKLATAVTDTARKRRTDPGNPDVCNIFNYHKLFSSTNELSEVTEGCRTAKIGCLDCKRILADNMNRELDPIRKRQKELWKKTEEVKKILIEGSEDAAKIAKETMREVRTKIGIGLRTSIRS